MSSTLRTFFGVTAIMLLSGCINDLLHSSDDPVAHRDANHCLNIARENAQHPVLGCEYERSYQVRVIDRVTNYHKREFQGRFNDQLLRFFAHSASPQVQLLGRRVDIWLAAAVLEPEEAFLMAVIASSDGNFSIRLPLNFDAWAITGDNVAWLGKEVHPSPRSVRTDRLILAPQPSFTPQKLNRFLKETGILARNDKLGRPLVQQVIGDGTVVRLDTRPFGAPQLVRFIQAVPNVKHTLAAITYETAPGLDTYQAKVFSFVIESGHGDANHNHQ